MVQLSHPYMTIWTFVAKVMSLLFNTLSRLVIAFLPRSNHLLISWLPSLTPVTLEPKKIKSVTVFFFPHLFARKWWDQMPWSWFFECWVLSQLFHCPLSWRQINNVSLWFLPSSRLWWGRRIFQCCLKCFGLTWLQQNVDDEASLLAIRLLPGGRIPSFDFQWTWQCGEETPLWVDPLVPDETWPRKG